MNIFKDFEVFIILTFIFFVVSFMCRKEMRVYVILLNIVFVVTSFLFVSFLIGIPKPIGYHLPFFSGVTFKGDNVYTLLDMYAPDDNSVIYLLVKKENEVRTYVTPYSDALIKEINDAFVQNNSFGFDIGFTGNFYNGDTSAHVPMAQFQKNNHGEKPPPGPASEQVHIQ